VEAIPTRSPIKHRRPTRVISTHNGYRFLHWQEAWGGQRLAVLVFTADHRLVRIQSRTNC